MKKHLIILLVLITVDQAFAQLGEERKTHEKEIIYSGEGKITLETGLVVAGKVTHSRLTQHRVSIDQGNGVSATYKLDEVKSFTLEAMFFEKILTPGIPISKYDFALVLSDPKSPVRVYEVCWQEDIAFGEDAQNGNWPTNWEYYVLFPAQEKMKTPSDIAFTPFVKKVSKLVEGCPELQKKVMNKEKGYAFGLIATAQNKLDVFINIANEYGSCK